MTISRTDPFAIFNPNSEVAGGGGADEATPECSRPRAQQLDSFEPRNIFQPPARRTWLRPGLR
jgi:hypothetical protein